jgi:hypothetical protein
MTREVRQFAESLGNKMLNSSPYYSQDNSQVEASNKILINFIEKKITDYTS